MAQYLVSRENKHYYRIACLIMQEGTIRIREHVLSHMSIDLPFEQALQCRQECFTKLVEKRILTQTQFKMLFPENGSVDISQIDMSLWIAVARNMTTGRRRIKWNEFPKEYETSWQHDMLRLKGLRNRLFHCVSLEINDHEYNAIKINITDILKRLGSSDDVINNHFTRDLDPEQTRICALQIREQCLEEMYQLSLAAAYQKRHNKIVGSILSVLVVLVIIALIVPITLFVDKKPPCRKALIHLESNSGILYFMPRKGWDALPQRKPPPGEQMPLVQKPVKMAVLYHSTVVQDTCRVTEDCCEMIQYLQNSALKSNRVPWLDIPYNFLIGNDGVVYEGRGAKYAGGATWHRNKEIISIELLGNYMCEAPSRAALMALYIFLEYIQHNDPSTEGGGEHPILTPDYNLYGECQVTLVTPEHNYTFPDSPGAAALNEILHWNHFGHDNITNCTTHMDCMKPPDCCRPCQYPLS